MATVTGITTARANEISNATIVSASVDSEGRLVLARGDGTTIVLSQIADTAFSQTPGKVTLKVYDAASDTVSDRVVIVSKWDVDGIPNERFIPSSPTALGSVATGVAFSPDGNYLAYSLNTSPFLVVWKRSSNSGEDFNTLSTPDGTPPTGAAGKLAWSPDGKFLAVPFANGLYVYMRSGTNVFLKAPTPSVYPGGVGAAVGWSKDGVYLALATDTAPYVTVYKRSGTTFTKLADIADTPAGAAGEVAFSNSGLYLAVAHATTPYVTIYSRSGDTFTKLAAPASLPAGQGRGLAWSADDSYLVVTHSTSPSFSIYKRVGSTFTKQPNPTALPVGNGFSAAWSPDGNYLAIGTNSFPNLFVYSRINDEFRLLPKVDVAPANGANDIDWSPDGLALVVAANNSSPGTYLYRSANVQPIGLSVPPPLIPSV